MSDLKQITIRVSAEDRTRIRIAAAHLDLSMSKFCEQAADIYAETILMTEPDEENG